MTKCPIYHSRNNGTELQALYRNLNTRLMISKWTSYLLNWRFCIRCSRSRIDELQESIALQHKISYCIAEKLSVHSYCPDSLHSNYVSSADEIMDGCFPQTQLYCINSHQPWPGLACTPSQSVVDSPSEDFPASELTDTDDIHWMFCQIEITG